MSFFSDIASSINIAGNWLLMLVFIGIGFGYGMLLGRNRLSLILVAGYISLLITKGIPWFLFFETKDIPGSNVQIFLFLAIILAIFFAAPHSGLSSFFRVSGRGKGGLWQALILGAVELGFLISGVVSFLPVKTIAELSPLAEKIFLKQPAQFLWLIIPLVAMIALKSRRSYRYGGDE